MMLIDSAHNVQLHWFNMHEGSYSPLQWQHHAQAELLSVSVAATCPSGVTLRFSDSNLLERSSSPLQWQQHVRAELLSALVVNFAMYAPPSTGPPPNPMRSSGSGYAQPPESATWVEVEVDDEPAAGPGNQCGWAGWVSDDDGHEGDEGRDEGHEGHEGYEGHEGDPNRPRRPRAVGPGGHPCIVAATCSSGAYSASVAAT
jgi:hypothetical protein